VTFFARALLDASGIKLLVFKRLGRARRFCRFYKALQSRAVS
jgi:hypothetical protein